MTKPTTPYASNAHEMEEDLMQSWRDYKTKKEQKEVPETASTVTHALCAIVRLRTRPLTQAQQND
jgi:hypothetical protein